MNSIRFFSLSLLAMFFSACSCYLLEHLALPNHYARFLLLCFVMTLKAEALLGGQFHFPYPIRQPRPVKACIRCKIAGLWGQTIRASHAPFLNLAQHTRGHTGGHRQDSLLPVPARVQVMFHRRSLWKLIRASMTVASAFFTTR